MKNLHWTILSLLLILSCSDSDEPQIVQRIDEINVFDVGNEGDVTDMRVVFRIRNVGRIGEFRIMVIPTGVAPSFDKKAAILLTSERYSTVGISNSERYSIRLSDLLDVEGNAIGMDRSYVIKVLMMGEEFNQLSMLQSNSLSLTDQGIYNGFYSGVLIHNIAGQGVFLPEGQTRTIVVSGQFTESSQANTYQASVITQTQGNFGGPVINEGSMRIRLIEGVIQDFEVSGALIPFESTYTDCRSTNSGQIEGTVKNDLQLEINGTGCPEGRLELLLIRAMQ